jgi:hypothetical protein
MMNLTFEIGQNNKLKNRFNQNRKTSGKERFLDSWNVILTRVSGSQN